MKYYAVPLSMLRQHGIGDESWRKRKDDKVLVNEAEVTDALGYPGSLEFEDETGVAPMTLREAKEWTDKQ